MVTFKIPKYAIPKLTSNKKYKEEAINELKQSLNAYDGKINNIVYYWRGKMVNINYSLVISTLIIEAIGNDVEKINVVNKESDYTYSFVEIS